MHYGLSPATLAAVQPHVALLPQNDGNDSAAVKVNVNTASAVVLAASEPKLSIADAERIVAARATRYFRSITDASQVLGPDAALFAGGNHDVQSRYFEVRGRLRLESIVLEERSLVRRDGSGNGTVVKTLSRERASFDDSVGLDSPPGFAR